MADAGYTEVPTGRDRAASSVPVDGGSDDDDPDEEPEFLAKLGTTPYTVVVMTILRRLLGLIVLPLGVQILWMVVNRRTNDRREMFFMSPNLGVPTLCTMTVVVISFVAMVVEWVGAFSSLLLVVYVAVAAYLACSWPREVVRFYLMGSVVIGILCAFLSEHYGSENINFKRKEKVRKERRDKREQARTLNLGQDNGSMSLSTAMMFRGYTYRSAESDDQKSAAREVSLYWHMFTTLKPKSARNFGTMLCAIFGLAVLTYYPVVSYFFQITVEFDVCRSHCLDAICEPDIGISRAEDVDLLPRNHSICMLHHPVVQFNKSVVGRKNVTVYDVFEWNISMHAEKDAHFPTTGPPPSMSAAKGLIDVTTGRK